ncbi:transposase [Streptomyces populi]|uniref:transposase n=1 Tax=Streptomyces populi TaxID=2058924 RepID=UPI0019D27C48|nr:transposase [Streptomyces populi]
MSHLTWHGRAGSGDSTPGHGSERNGTLGLVLAVLVTAANVHDTAGGKHLLDGLAAAHPNVSKVWADGGYRSSILNHGARLGIDVEVVQRPRAT